MTEKQGMITTLLLSFLVILGCGSHLNTPNNGHRHSESNQMNSKTDGQKNRFSQLSAPGSMQMIKVGDTALSVFDSGVEGVDGQAIVLLHGLGEHAGYWNEIVPGLVTARKRVIVLDLAGHGRSAKPNRDYSMHWHAALVHGVLNSLKINEPVTLVGHSMGGHIALRFSRAYPDKVAKLVLIAPAGIERFTANESAWLIKLSTVKALAGKGSSALRAHFKRNVFGRWSHVAEEHLNERLQLVKDPDFIPYIQAVVSSIKGMLKDQVSYELDKIHTPTYLLFGAQDRLIPNPYLHTGTAKDVAELAQQQLPNLQDILILPKIGHMPQIEAPRQVERFILRTSDLENDQTPKVESESSSKTNKLRKFNMNMTLIKRYPNRRLYDTERSAYITLDDLAEDLTRGSKVKIIDSKTNEDLTQRVMLQAMLTDQHAHKLKCLPVDFLRTILQLEDPTMRTMFNHYVRVTLSSFSMAQSAMQHNLDIMKKFTPSPSDFLQGLASIVNPTKDRS